MLLQNKQNPSHNLLFFGSSYFNALMLVCTVAPWSCLWLLVPFYILKPKSVSTTEMLVGEPWQLGSKITTGRQVGAGWHETAG